MLKDEVHKSYEQGWQMRPEGEVVGSGENRRAGVDVRERERLDNGAFEHRLAYRQ